jgi:hypothetical protein
MSVYLPHGQKVAEASFHESGANTARVLTMRDGKDQEIQISPSSKPRKQVIDWLVRNNYL